MYGLQKLPLSNDAKTSSNNAYDFVFDCFLSDIYASSIIFSERNSHTIAAKASWMLKVNRGQVNLKDGAYYCYCAYVLRISRYSDFLSPMLTNTWIFLRGLRLSGESRS